jgi:digeranylgeranylglycerophospholipid reductase
LLDIAIIGGGPVGSRVAYQTAGMGYDVAVFEKRSIIGQKPCCTGIISQECVQHFDIPEKVIIKPINTATLVPPSGDFLRISRSETQAYVLDRSAFNLDLAHKAQNKGAQYYLNSNIEDLSCYSDKVVIKVNHNTKIFDIESRIVVISAGFSSPFLKRLGVGKIHHVVGGAQTEIEGIGLNGVEIFFNQEIAPGYFAWLVPIKDKKYLAGLLTRRSPGKRLRAWLTQLEIAGRIRTGKHQIHYGGIPLKPLAKTYANRLLIVGDSAGQVKPTTGGGIYFGLLAADIAAGVLHNALREQDYSARFLSNYERKWRKKLGHELRMEYLARCLYERLNNKQIDALFARFKTAGIVDFISRNENISFDWHGDLLIGGLKAGLASEIGRIIKLPDNIAGR